MRRVRALVDSEERLEHVDVEPIYVTAEELALERARKLENQDEDLYAVVEPKRELCRGGWECWGFLSSLIT